MASHAHAEISAVKWHTFEIMSTLGNLPAVESVAVLERTKSKKFGTLWCQCTCKFKMEIIVYCEKVHASKTCCHFKQEGGRAWIDG